MVRFQLFLRLRRFVAVGAVGVGVGVVEVAVFKKAFEGEENLADPRVSDEDEMIGLAVKSVVTETSLRVPIVNMAKSNVM
jgi:hypothetical protein